MLIHTAEKTGFYRIWSQGMLPAEETESIKKPFIRLMIAAHGLNCDYLMKGRFGHQILRLGTLMVSDSNFIITVTGRRKTMEVIRILMLDPNYRHPLNLSLWQKLTELNEKIKNTPVTEHSAPMLSKNVKNYNVILSRIAQSSHEVVRVKKKNSTYTGFLKYAHVGRATSEKEAFDSICYQLLLNKNTPKMRSVINDQKYKIGVLSEEIPDFISLCDYYYDKKNGVPAKTLIAAKIGRIIAAAYCEEENDLSGSNIGVNAQLTETFKIDHDQSSWSSNSKYHFTDSEQVHFETQIEPKNTFIVSAKDIESLPFLTVAKPRSWPDRSDYIYPGKTTLVPVNGMKNNADFIRDKFLIFLKRILISDGTYRNIAEATISNPIARIRYAKIKTDKTKELEAALLKCESFINFLRTDPLLKRIIIDEFKVYNDLYRHYPALQVDLLAIEQKIDQLMSGIQLEKLSAQTKLISLNE